ncbi:gamma-glutamyltransferase [Paracoccidioides brasiliensis Pb18]|uniref:Gamma-glutamyltransferase n=2 Tax=Paracoccidioides brasiliensis TaxID=121759 RepID=C1G3G3_PARBD|nr:gamma-glutamyltransferase [Paracoccidioides brasiliensis Pb18]EEH45329.2 gamma-glutamyltransferase [Paracoccidioides brasiliensis Pb18]ODH14773.1 gamma-glutamyltransferase [Paracoccidioides brasiliensis]ODH52255.1 gamma-glutamyltransferase [Paracoccidioides brasiliensis]
MPLGAADVFSAPEPKFSAFPSRRSVVHSTKGIVACTQPLAAAAGQRILRNGGNAADAAVAVAAALNVTEPSSTGIGGDMFCLFYNAKTKEVHALNGSGRAAGYISLDLVRKELGLAPGEEGKIPMTSVHSVTTPGAAAGWVDTVERFGSGKLSLEQILLPAIELGEEGFPVSELAAKFWEEGEDGIRKASPNFREMLKVDPDGEDGVRSPKAGEIFWNPTLAQTFRTLAKEGKKGFYQGRIGEAIVKVVQDLGGYLTLDDLKYHAEVGSQAVDAISLKLNPTNIGGTKREGKGEIEIWEHPPNGQGIVALMALGILDELSRTGKIPHFTSAQHNSSVYLHAIIESLRIAFADASWWVTDSDVEKVPTKQLISRSYLAERAKLFNPDKAVNILDRGSPAHNHCDTVYFAVTDHEGNGISFINSNYGGFGTGIIPQGCGFTLQNRGANFSLTAGHPNVIAPRKRPYHTIIPAMITNPFDNSLHSVYGVMGGFMQPQGHVQVLMNMLAFNQTPQEALDAPRICIGAGMPERGKPLDRTVYLEEGIEESVVEGLRELGHNVMVLKGFQRGMFGRGQVIRCHFDEGKLIYSAGSDMRGDGAAFPV